MIFTESNFTLLVISLSLFHYFVNLLHQDWIDSAVDTLCAKGTIGNLPFVIFGLHFDNFTTSFLL